MQPFTPVIVGGGLDEPVCRSLSCTAASPGGIGPFQTPVWAQVHGVSSALVEYVVIGAPGTVPPGVSPDRSQLPDQRTPILIPAGAVLSLVPVGAGTRAFTVVTWPWSP